MRKGRLRSIANVLLVCFERGRRKRNQSLLVTLAEDVQIDLRIRNLFNVLKPDINLLGSTHAQVVENGDHGVDLLAPNGSTSPKRTSVAQ